MARRRKAGAGDPLADLASKTEILERELAVQRAAMERLKEMSQPAVEEREVVVTLPQRRTA